MEQNFKEQFHNPGAWYRSIPFWAWNGAMDEEELKSQVRQMKQAGVGGFFIHSRIGLETEYLGTEWMNCVKAVVAEAKAQGLYAWLYDEDRWPSGTAGGRVTSQGDAFRCKGLTLEICPVEKYREIYQKEIEGGQTDGDRQIGIVAVYQGLLQEYVTGEMDAAREQSGWIKSFQRLELSRLGEETWDALEKEASCEEVLLVVRLEVSAPSDWFNHEAPPDNLNPDCVKLFIQETHERYKAVVGEEFGRTIPGIFTDEPSLNDRFTYFGEHKSWIPWTYGFAAYFQENTGYDFLDVLPLFYFEGKGSVKVRHDYWRCVTQRYGESYFKVIGEWCEENHLLFTGHFLQEDKLGLCTRVNGAVMPHYQYQHVPGIDMLTEQTREYLTVKQCTSVASQLGKKQVLSETYGCTGWDFTFEGQKWMGDWQYVLGVNRRCQHLMLYSLRGCRKRDYPPSFNYNTNWWQENVIVDDYFARLSLMLEQGEAVRNILVIHPSSTAWARLGVNPYGNPKRKEERDVPGINEYGNQFNTLLEALMRRHLDCDLGDELLIRSYGSVGTDPRFVVGRTSYQAVVVPQVDTLLLSTCEKLWEFMENGGYVYALNPHPFMIEGGEEQEELQRALQNHSHWVKVYSIEELVQRLTPYRSIRIAEANGEECPKVLYQLRKTEEEAFLFLVNNSREEEADVVVELSFAGTPVKLELLTGEIVSEIPYREEGGRLYIPVHLERCGSAAYALRQYRRVQAFEENFAYRLTEQNVLPLDMCRYRMAEEEWSEPMEIWQAQKRIRKTLGMRENHHNGIEQRYKWIRESHPMDGCRVELSFAFVSKQCFSEVALAMERPEEFRIWLNGEEISWNTAGWLLDKEIKKCKLPDIRQGENHLLLSCEYRNDFELENVYLEGQFGVTLDRQLAELPKTLSVGSWTGQGLKHYCGSVIYQLSYFWGQEDVEEADKIVLRLPRIDAVCVRLRVNGYEQLLPWDFQRNIFIEKWMKLGQNRIELEVVGSPRNMMGPFHLKEKPVNTNDGAFCPGAEKYSPEYLLTDYGIMGKIMVYNFSFYK